ncbi:XRE family transcriptional regulator [Psychrobacter sp. AT9]|uniref:XRE family transcriptional regulator n=1 Tax=Psychrobacter sp. AT9 TaxID=3242893 RepID=UPI0039A4D5B7
MDTELNTLAKRVKSMRDKRGLSQAQLGDAIGADQSVIANLERRDGKSSKYTPQLATALGVDVAWLLTGVSSATDANDKLTGLIQVGTFEPWDDETPLNGDEVALPFYREVELSAGSGRKAIVEDTNRKLRFSKRTLHKAGVDIKDAITMKVAGDSMERLITDGATIGVDTSKANEPIKDNRIYALESGGDLRCKYIQRAAGGKVKLISENDMYDDEIYSMDEFSQLYRIIGWVFWWSTIAKW